jgi:chorismate-pyruvate lyase
MSNVAKLAGPAQAEVLRHFVLQEARPPHLGHVELIDIDPVLRGMLFTDGTVTRALEVQLFSRAAVEVVAQATTSASASVAMHLGAASGVETVCRRVVIGTGELFSPLIWAESHILPSRLPREFLGVLGDAPDGIGESLQQIQLESWRELLWFGLGSSPPWSDSHTQADTQVITRLYRVITAGKPALLISESFAVTQRNGVYALDCVS